jgi:hypothetical protein
MKLLVDFLRLLWWPISCLLRLRWEPVPFFGIGMACVILYWIFLAFAS